MPRKKVEVQPQIQGVPKTEWKELAQSLREKTIEEEKQNEIDIFGKPLPFKEFIKTIQGEIDLSDVQLEELLNVLGEGGRKGNPETFFTLGTRPRLAVFLWGKGSGKGTVTSLAILYEIYLLHFLKPDPYTYFNISPNDPLSVVIVSTSEEQAVKFLTRISSRVKSCTFFRQFPIYDSGSRKIINEGKYLLELGEYPITITSEKVKFSFLNLEVVSVPSRNESFEGNTIIGFVMDEASGHMSAKGSPNAEKIFKTLKTSTRDLPYLGFITSYPRGTLRTDFTYERFREIMDGKVPDGYASHRTSWEANPSRYLRPDIEYFRVDVKGFEKSGLRTTYLVPVSLKPDFEREFNNAVAAYLAIPVGETKERWISIFDKVEDDIFLDANRPPVIRFRHIEKVNAKGLPIVQIEFDKEKDVDKTALALKNYFHYFLGLDAGQTDSNAAMVLAHGIIQQGVPILVVDAILLWKPDKKRGVMVDLLDFMKKAIEIAELFNIRLIRSDRWQTAPFTNIVANWNTTPAGRMEYNMLKALLSNNPPLIRLPWQQESKELLAQLKELETPTNDTSKPRVRQGHQDLADALACAVGAFMELFSINPETFTFELKAPEVEVVNKDAKETFIAFVEKAPPTAPLSALIPPQVRNSSGVVAVPTGRRVIGGPVVPPWVKMGSF